MKKRVAACMTAACLAATTVGMAVGLTGCGGGSGNKFPTQESDPTASLSILLLANAQEQVFYNEYFSQLATKYGIKIYFEGLEEGPYYQKLGPAIQQGNVPDIFYVRPNEILQYKKKIFCLEQFKDTVLDNENLNLDLKNIYPLALDLYKYNDKTNKLDEKDGELYAFPKDLSTQQLGYNKTIVEKYTTEIKAAGLKLPWEMNFETENYTWAQYREMCEIINEAAAAKQNTHYACDVPDIEILAKSFGGGILNTDNMKVSITSDAVTKAISYQKDLVTPSGNHGTFAAADYANAVQAGFQKGEVAFYGAVGSWEVGAYDNSLGKDNWDVMPWPTEDGSVNWYGKITSAGYVVSNQCKNWQVAMEIAASFMTYKVQNEMVREKKISIPLDMRLRSDYENTENDATYSPKSRGVFLDVISGEHGFRPAKYYTFKDGWQKPLSDKLELIWTHDITSFDVASVQSAMQEQLDIYKNQY